MYVCLLGCRRSSMKFIGELSVIESQFTGGPRAACATLAEHYSRAPQLGRARALHLTNSISALSVAGGASEPADGSTDRRVERRSQRARSADPQTDIHPRAMLMKPEQRRQKLQRHTLAASDTHTSNTANEPASLATLRLGSMLATRDSTQAARS